MVSCSLVAARVVLLYVPPRGTAVPRDRSGRTAVDLLDTIRKGVLTLLNMGPRDPTLLHVRCGVCGKAANTIVDIDTPKWVVQLEARSPRRLAKPPCRTCFLRPRLSPHAPGGSPPHAVATSQQLQRPPPLLPV